MKTILSLFIILTGFNAFAAPAPMITSLKCTIRVYEKKWSEKTQKGVLENPTYHYKSDRYTSDFKSNVRFSQGRYSVEATLHLKRERKDVNFAIVRIFENGKEINLAYAYIGRNEGEPFLLSSTGANGERNVAVICNGINDPGDEKKMNSFNYDDPTADSESR